MSTILILTVNDPQNSLKKLSEEGKEIQRILNAAPARTFDTALIPDASIQDLISEFKVPDREIEVLHFAGHANSQGLQFTDDRADASILAGKIRLHRSLKLVFLNGCATRKQVQYFHEAGVPFVVATSRPVGDSKAHWIATQFYQYLTLKRSLKKAWQEVVSDVDLLKKKLALQTVRGVMPRVRETNTDQLEWGLYIKENKEGIDYQLPFSTSTLNKISEVSHTIFLDELIFALDYIDNPHLQKLQILSSSIKRGSSVPNNKKIAELLNTLPYTLGLRLRYITAEPDIRSREYYRELLYDYAFFFETLLHESFALLCAQIWQDKEKAFNQLPEEVGSIRHFLRENRLTENPYTYAKEILILIEWLRLYNVQPVPFSDSLMDYLQSDDFKEASNFFFLQKQYFWQNIQLQEMEALTNAIQAQHYIKQSFPHFNFLVNYILVSVRGINVMNFRHLPKHFNPIENMVSRLILTESEPMSLSGKQMMENKSVLSFYKSQPGIGTKSLNLFPFIIDRNVFTGKINDEVDLYLFTGYFRSLSKGEAFHFVSIKDPGKVWRFDLQEHNVSLLHIDETTSIIHEQNHLMANAWEFKNYLAEYHSQFLQFLQS